MFKLLKLNFEKSGGQHVNFMGPVSYNNTWFGNRMLQLIECYSLYVGCPCLAIGLSSCQLDNQFPFGTLAPDWLLLIPIAR